ncbi:hypothetical protein EYC84_011373 [Monilinia fructicola]|uniref:Uncharacterized protein n=1 Tax=Monilinia fructicola TaxID=38448 RepID=A0A5M9J9W4_MONFR|nr:hypothetical protein EYC84_011373 [Monilinia fructicola]
MGELRSVPSPAVIKFVCHIAARLAALTYIIVWLGEPEMFGLDCAVYTSYRIASHPCSSPFLLFPFPPSNVEE